MIHHPQIIYHRGRHGTMPNGEVIQENTLRAFEAAIEEGAYMVEFDVWNNLRITHDPNPTADVPTLDDALHLIRGRCAVNIEIKSPAERENTMKAVEVALSTGNWKKKQFVISSFHHETAIKLAREYRGLMQTAIINDGVLPPHYIDWIADQGVDGLHCDWMNILMDRENKFEMYRALSRNGMWIRAWTVNTLEQCEALGTFVNAIFTDVPHLFPSPRRGLSGGVL